MASFGSLRTAIYEKEERKQQYQAQIQGLNAYDRHKKFLNDYANYYGKERKAVNLWVSAEEEILGKKMKDWLRFSVAFWHTFRGTGSDPFGVQTKFWPWEDGTNSLAMAKRRMKANFEFLNKLGVDLWCFHDKDIAPDGKTLEETNANLDEIVALAEELQFGILLFVVNNVYAVAQVKKAIEVTHYLGGENYVFWGGREGYQSLLNTDMKKELDHLARFLQGAVAHKKKIGFNGTLLIEPKQQEPTKHHYDWHAATATAFLQKYGLIGRTFCFWMLILYYTAI
ncbi:xylose isomerase [Ranunculus cassubicifolius]